MENILEKLCDSDDRRGNRDEERDASSSSTLMVYD